MILPIRRKAVVEMNIPLRPKRFAKLAIKKPRKNKLRKRIMYIPNCSTNVPSFK